MAFQMTPFAWMALRYGATAAAGFAAARMAPRGRFPTEVEAEMDATPSGFRLRKARGQLSGSIRTHRDWRIGRLGPRFRIDGTALARLRIKRLT